MSHDEFETRLRNSPLIRQVLEGMADCQRDCADTRYLNQEQIKWLKDRGFIIDPMKAPPDDN